MPFGITLIFLAGIPSISFMRRASAAETAIIADARGAIR